MELGTPTFILGETHLTNRDSQHLGVASFEIVLFFIFFGFHKSSLVVLGFLLSVFSK